MGNLTSPGGLPLDTIFGGGGSLDLNINFSGSTQFNQAFNVRAQSQDGLPEGDLVGIDIEMTALSPPVIPMGVKPLLVKYCSKFPQC